MKRPTKLPEAAFVFEEVPKEAPRPKRAPGALSPLSPVPKAEEPLPKYREQAAAVRRELAVLMNNGMLPEGFDLKAAMADPAFIELSAELPPYAAVRVYAAEQKAADAEEQAMENILQQLRSREGLPRAARAEQPVSPERDYENMSTEEFLRLEQEMKKRARNGLTTRL